MEKFSYMYAGDNVDNKNLDPWTIFMKTRKDIGMMFGKFPHEVDAVNMIDIWFILEDEEARKEGQALKGSIDDAWKL